ncbi:MAG: hypothetical protein ACRC8W_13525 [Plesiomonas shigelloides]
MKRKLTTGQNVKIIIIDPKSLWHKLYDGCVGAYLGYDESLSVYIVQAGNGMQITCDDVEPIGKTLLEILVDELPKRGGWPDWAEAAVQDGDGVIKDYVKFAGHGFNIRHGGRTWCGNGVGCWGDNMEDCADFTASMLATDHATKIVTREEYEQAVAIKATDDMVKASVKRLTDACAQHEEVSVEKKFGISFSGIAPTKEAKEVDTEILNPDYLPELDRIRKLREERDLAEKKYNNQFVSGEIEIRKLNLGDKIIFERDSLGIVMEVTKVVRGIFEHECHLQGLPPHAAFVSVLTIHDVSRFAKVS